MHRAVTRASTQIESSRKYDNPPGQNKNKADDFVMPPRTKLTVPAPYLERGIHEIVRTTRRNYPTDRVDATQRV
jgi:hypothetical protein